MKRSCWPDLGFALVLALAVLGICVHFDNQEFEPYHYREASDPTLGYVSIGPRWVLWCLDDDGVVVPVQPDLVRRGRLIWLKFGELPFYVRTR